MSGTDWRGLCEELLLSWDADGCDWKPQHQARWNATVDRARVALAQPEPEVVGPMQLPEQAPDEHPPSNLDRRETAAWYHGHGCGWQAARAVLARWGSGQGILDNSAAPAPAGEVGELVEWLRMQGDALKPGPNSLLSDRTKSERHAAGMKLTRAADLLERQAAPVPVAVGERWPEFSDCDPSNDCVWCFNPALSLWNLSLINRTIHTHWLPASALPLPTTEPQP